MRKGAGAHREIQEETGQDRTERTQREKREVR